jgi:iron complex transport system substrate-binding protein
MPRRTFLALCLLWWSAAALAGTVVDATCRSVEVPERIVRVLAAGPPAAVMLAALAPDLMLRWTSPMSDDAPSIPMYWSSPIRECA